MQRTIFSVLVVILLTASASFAYTEKEVEAIIEKAENLSSQVEHNKELGQYVPYKIYGEALIQLLYSRNMLEKKKLNSAYFYGIVSTIKLETALLYAEAEKLKMEKIALEQEYLRKKNKELADKAGRIAKENEELRKQGPKTVIIPEKRGSPSGIEDFDVNPLIDAKLQRIGKNFRIELADRKLFLKKKYILHARGRETLDRIIKVLKLYPQCTVKIIGHTRQYDYKGYSKRKARIVADYFIKNDVEAARVSHLGISNSEVMDTYAGYRRVDRIEVVISGIMKIKSTIE